MSDLVELELDVALEVVESEVEPLVVEEAVADAREVAVEELLPDTVREDVWLVMLDDVDVDDMVKDEVAVGVADPVLDDEDDELPEGLFDAVADALELPVEVLLAVADDNDDTDADAEVE